MSRGFYLTCAGVLVAGVLCACSSAQSRKASYIAQGKAHLASANYDKARVEFQNAAQIDPNDPEPRRMLGQVAEKMGDARAALGQYQAAITLDPNDVAARAALARLFLFAGIPKRALDLVEPALAADSRNAQLLTVRGGARAQLGDTQAALADAQLALQLAPDDLYAIALLASIYKAQFAFDKGIAVVQAGLQRFPNDADLHTMLAQLELGAQQPQKAEAELRRLVELEPHVLNHRYLLAGFYLQSDNVDAAEETLRAAVSSQPESSDAKLQLVDMLAERRDMKQATAQIDQYFAAEPRNDELKLMLGEFLAQHHEPVAAERAFRAVIAHAGLAADGLAARNRLASLMIERNDTTAASALIAEVLKQNVRDNDALMLRSNIALVQGDTQSAITDLRAILRDRPNDVSVMRTLARAYQQNDESNLAEQTLRSAVQVSPKDFESRLDLAQALIAAAEFDEAAGMLRQLAADNPGSVPVQESTFRLYVTQKDYASALAAARRIQLLAPKQAVGYYLAGLVDEAQHASERAARDYDDALQHQPDAEVPLAAVVRLDLSRKQPVAAMTHIEAAIAHSPDNALAYKLKAEVLMSEEKTDAAIAAYQQTTQVAPSWYEGYEGLALAQSSVRHYDDAIATLQSGITKTGGSSTLIASMARLYIRLDRVDDALAVYEGMLAKNPKSSFAANNLAMMLVTYRNTPTNLERAQKLSDQLASSTDPSAIDTRGWVKFKSGDPQSAESLLQRAVDKRPADAEMRYHLAMAELRDGRQQAAQQNLQTALKSEQPFTGRDEAKATLARLK